MMETFGEFIRKRRIEKGLTLTQLGALLGVDSGALSKIEHGKKKLVDKSLPKLAKVFKLDLNHIRDEYYSEMIAYEVFENKCSEKVLEMAEQKVRYIKTKNAKQGSLDFTS